MFDSLSRKLHRYLSLRRVVGLYRRRLSRAVFTQCDGVIQHGAFAGMRWLDNPGWGRSEQGVMVLGLYEQEVQENLSNAPDKFRVFVDVGAADGYYAVGLAYSGRVDRSVAFEMLPECRSAIARLADVNQVREKLTILGAAADDFLAELAANHIVSAETMFLFDIEGAEFEVLTAEVFAFLSRSLIVVETHAHIYADPKAELDNMIRRASKTHRVTRWYPGARNPWTLRELDRYTEIDRWILCSEGRTEPQEWLRFDPL